MYVEDPTAPINLGGIQPRETVVFLVPMVCILCTLLGNFVHVIILRFASYSLEKNFHRLERVLEGLVIPCNSCQHQVYLF